MTSSSQDVQTGNVKDALPWKRRNLSTTATDGYNSEQVHGQTLVPLYVSQEKQQPGNGGLKRRDGVVN